MKATSIEQIREHLAKGGRALAVLKDGRTDEVKRVDMGMLRVYAGIWSSSFACVDVDHWQLLPLEEKEPVPVDHGTQKGQDIKAELAKRGMEAPLMSLWLSTHIRQKLLFGQVPTMDELLQWWEDTSGERIEHGKRCERCQCSGKIKRDAGSSYKDVPCDDCQGSGYSVRPTWMEERK